jgi:type VI secretion system secreted protein Hcp
MSPSRAEREGAKEISMKTSRIPAVLILAAAFVLAPAARAAVDAFIWFENADIRGESKDPQHLNWIEVSSFQIDRLRNAAIGGATGGGAGKVSVHDISITKHVDASSAKIFQACVTGKHYQKVLISMRKAGGDPSYMNIVLHDVFLSSYQKSSGGDRPTESLTLNFTKLEYNQPPPHVQPGVRGAELAPAAIQLAPTATPTPARRAAPPPR